MVRNSRSALDVPAVAVATVFGAGFFPIWPGTLGSALGIMPVLLLRPLDPMSKVAVYAILFMLCVWAAHRAEGLLGGSDHRSIVCDETWGMAVVWECTSGDPRWMVASFVAFRLLDALKPGPIGTVERSTRGGFGVMADDAAAAAAAIALVLALDAVLRGAGW